MATPTRPTALITGATSGIGAAYARRFALEGYDLIITGRRESKIRALAEELGREHSVEVEVVIIELSDPVATEGFLDRIRSREIDVLVNNAGFGTARDFLDESLDIQEQMVSVHILCAMKLIYALLPAMVRRKSGIIINVASSGAFLATPALAVYDGTKAFLRAFTESLHLELMGSGVQFQVVCPGLTRTDFPEKVGIAQEVQVDHRMFRWLSSEDVVEASIKDLKRGRVVCIPGWLTKVSILFRPFMSGRAYYAMMRESWDEYRDYVGKLAEKRDSSS